MLLLYLFQVFLLFSFSSWIPSCLWHKFCDCPTLFEHSNFLVYSFCILAREVPSDFSSCSLICFLATSRLLVHLSVSYLFAFSYYSWGSQGKNIEVVCHPLLHWTTICQNSPPWPVHLVWPYIAWLIVSRNCTRVWSMWSVWLVFCDCGFHFVCPQMDKDKRLMEAFWRERLPEGGTGSCSDGWLHAQ